MSIKSLLIIAMKKHKNKCRCVQVLFILCEAASLVKPAIRSNVLARAPRIPLLSGLVGCKNHASKTWPRGDRPLPRPSLRGAARGEATHNPKATRHCERIEAILSLSRSRKKMKIFPKKIEFVLDTFIIRIYILSHRRTTEGSGSCSSLTESVKENRDKS